MQAFRLVSLAFLAVSSAVPATDKRRDSYNRYGGLDSCAKACKDTPTKFSYSPGTTYIYDYSVETETSMAGASEDAAKLSIQASAEIQATGGCEFALILKNVQVSHTDAYSGSLRPSDREDDFQNALQNSILRFAFDDGVISAVCPETEETNWALNFKKGLLTAFQNSMESLNKPQTVSEVDVTGECEAEYKVTSTWGWNKEIKLSKTKNLLLCSRRDSYKSMFQIIPYKVDSDVQSLPIMKGTHKCDYTIDSRKILTSATCEETHLYVPFSREESGGKTKVQLSLTLKNQKNGVDAATGPIKDRLSLLFEHEGVMDQVQNGPESLEQKLKEICEQTREDIRPETPRLYSELVQIIKVLSKADIERAYKLVKEKSICPTNDKTIKFFMDALPMAGTEGAVSLMATLINGRQVQGTPAKAWVLSLFFIQDPTQKMMEECLKLLQGPLSSDALLPVSALVSRYCKKSGTCDSDYYMGQIMNFLKNKIPISCRVDDRNLNDVLATLRALGNIGDTSIIPSLDDCIISQSSPLEVRVAAADAYRRMPCDSSIIQEGSALWTVLLDSTLDSELRITAYLSLMRCPDDETLTQISDLLEKETDNHVGGFIYSHIQNLKDTSDPLKQGIAKDISLHSFKKFELNVLKYSSNHEASLLIDRLNLGFTADSNMIMSPRSPLPRSAMLNLTVDLFGSSINLLEIGGRLEGSEILVEKLLGPSGYFPSKNEGEGKVDDVKGSVYARVFGSEIFYKNFKGTQAWKGSGKMPNLMDILISLSDKQAVAYTYSEQLMDVSFTVPTLAGLPLELTVNGSMNLDLKAEGKVDLRSVARVPRSMEIDGEFKPSAALEITGTMAVRAMTTKMGLRMRNTMHSSTSLKGHILIQKGRELDIEIDPPADKMEIFNAKSQFFIVHNEVEKEQDMVKDNYQEHKLCSGDKVTKVIGIELCGELRYPNASSRLNSPYFPLTGPTSLSIQTFRRDTHTSYKILGRRMESKESSTAQFQMDTPNSEVNRMISTDVTISYTPDKKLDINVQSPWRKFNLNSALVLNDDLKSFVSSVLVDDKNKYGLTTELKVTKSGTNVAYAPTIELTMGDLPEVLLSGQVNVDLSRKIDADLDVKGLGMVPYNVKGGLSNLDKEKRVQVSLSRKGKNMYLFNLGSTIERSGRNLKIEPSLEIQAHDQTLVKITGSSDYKADKQAAGDLTVVLYKMKPSSVSWKLNQAARGKPLNYDIDLKVKSSLLTGALEGDVTQQGNALSSKIKLTYNVPKYGTDVVTWTSKLNNNSKNTFWKYNLVSNIDLKTNTDYNMGVIAKFDHKKKITGVDVEFKYGANPKDKKKMVTLKTNLNRDITNWKNANVDMQLKAQAPEKNIDFNIKMDHSHTPKKLDSNVNFKFSPFMKNVVDAGISLQDKSGPLRNYIGQANLGIMGKKFVISNDLTQKSAKHFQNLIGVQDFDGKSHSINTVYKIQGSQHEVNADLNVVGYKPVKLQGKTSLDLVNFQVSGSAMYDKDLYNVSAQTRYIDDVKRLNFGLEYPDRKVEAEIEGKNMKDKVSGTMSVDWDVKRNSKSKVSVEGMYRNSGSWDSKVVSGSLNFKSPFAKFEDVSADASYNSDVAHYSTKGKVSWGGKQDTLSSTVVVKRPISLKQAEITFTAITPIRQYREIEVEINHKLEPFVSSVKAKLENNKAELIVKGDSKNDRYNTDFSGSVELKTPFSVLRDASVFLEHKDNGRRYNTIGFFEHNSRKYGAELQMDHSQNRDALSNNGNMTLSWPEDKLQTTWQHSSQGARQIKCNLESNWSGNKRVTFNLVGSNENLRSIAGTVSVNTPWRTSREVLINFESTVEDDRYSSTASLLKNRVEEMVYNIEYKTDPNARNAMFMVKTPLYAEKIHGQTNVDWNSYPVTASAGLSWASSSRVDFDGSLNAESFDDIEVNAKIVTPFKHFENVLAGASHKLINSEYVSHAKVSYAVRKAIEFESRLRYDNDVQLFRIKLTSPCQYFSLFNTGVELKTSNGKLDGTADFELLPYVKKYDGFVTVNNQPGNFNSKFRLNTPLRHMPYFQVIAWSKKNDNSLRASHIEVEPSSYGVYSLDSTYRIDIPFQFEMSVKSPNPQYNGVGVTAQFTPKGNIVDSKLVLMYLADNEIDLQLKLSLKNNLEGSLTIDTPFPGYESSKIVARHERRNGGFICYGLVNAGGKNVQGDVVYTSSASAVTGSVILTSNIDGMERLSGNFSHRGPLNKMKVEATVDLGFNFLSVALNNDISPNLYKASALIRTRNTDDLKLSLQHKDSSSTRISNLESDFLGEYGDQSASGKISLYNSGLEKTKVDVSLNTKIAFTQVGVESSLNAESLSGKGTLRTNLFTPGDFEVSYDISGPSENQVSSLAVSKDGESWYEAQLETSTIGDGVHGKIFTKYNSAPLVSAELDYSGTANDFNTKASISYQSGVIFYKESSYKVDGTDVDISNTLKLKFGEIDRTHEISFHKEGTLDDFKMDVTRKCDGEEITAKAYFEAKNKMVGGFEINNLNEEYDKLGAEFEHTRNDKSCQTKGKITTNSNEAITGNLKFFNDKLKRVEVSADVSTPWAGYRYSSIDLKHEGKESGINCNLNIKYGDNQIISSDLTTQCSLSSHSIAFNLRTPYRGYKDISLSGDFDTKKANGRAVLGDGNVFTITGVHDPSVYPYNFQYQITTHLSGLEKASFSLNGLPLDGKVSVSAVSNSKRIDLTGALKYDSPFKLGVSTELRTDFRGYRLLEFNLKNEDTASKGKTTHLLVSWDPTKQVAVDGRYFTGSTSWSSKKERVLELDIKLPLEKYRSFSTRASCNSEARKIHSVISFEVDQSKLIDLDVNYDYTNKFEYSAILRKPYPMEYTTTYQIDDYSKEGDVYVSWNRDDPSSNLRIKGSLKNRPANNDRSMTLTYISSAHTVGVEQSLATTTDKFVSSGKIFWDQDDDSKLSYSVDMSKSNRRSDRSYNGDFKLGFPTRTLAVSGSMSNNGLVQTADAAFSWDQGRDDSKRVEMQVSLSGQEYTKADISLKLPSNVQVASALILNQGNIIFDGKTDISYSNEAQKTLTLFSKLRNTPSSYSYFSSSGDSYNYSMELGMRHPETKVDIKIDSHVAKSNDLLTSSIGVRYMNVLRQMKNVQLFAEIDKLKKQISVVATTPSQDVGVVGTMVSDDPFNLVLIGSQNGEERFTSTLDVNKASKSLMFEIGQRENLLSFKSFYPNNTAIQTELFHKKNNNGKQEAVIGLRLLNPYLLHSSFRWRPAAVDEMKNYMLQQILLASRTTQDNLRQMNADLLTELTGKYEVVTASLGEDLRPLLIFIGNELELFASDIDRATKNVQEMYAKNEFFLKDVSDTVSNNFATAGRTYNYMQNKLQLSIDLYREAYENMIQTLSDKLDQMEEYSFSDSYNEVVTRALVNLIRVLDGRVMAYLKYIKNTDFRVMETAKNVFSNVKDLYNHPRLRVLKERIEALKDIDYLNDVKTIAGKLGDLEPYSNALSSLKTNAWNRIIPESVRDMTEFTTNEIYNQARLAYKHWEIQENLDLNLKRSTELLNDIINDEVSQMMNLLLIRSPITVFDPENGIIEANFILPFEMKSFDSLPDSSPYVQLLGDVYNRYGSVYKYAPNYFYGNKSQAATKDLDNDFDDDISSLNTYKPSNTLQDRYAYQK